MSTSAPPDTLSIVLGNGPATTAFGLDIRLDGQDSVHTVHAAGPGIFRARRRPSDPAAGADGALLAKGSILGFLQRGPLLLPVYMPHDGWLLATVPEGGRVQYGSPLFSILCATGAIIP